MIIEMLINNANIYIVFVEFFVGLLFLFACLKIFECWCVRGISGRLTNIEIICAMTFVGAMFCGLSSLIIENINIVSFFVILALLLSSYICNHCTTLLIGVSASIGALFYSNNPTLPCVFMLYAMAATMFKTKNKYPRVYAKIKKQPL